MPVCIRIYLNSIFSVYLFCFCWSIFAIPLAFFLSLRQVRCFPFSFFSNCCFGWSFSFILDILRQSDGFLLLFSLSSWLSWSLANNLLSVANYRLYRNVREKKTERVLCECWYVRRDVGLIFDVLYWGFFFFGDCC